MFIPDFLLLNNELIRGLLQNSSRSCCCKCSRDISLNFLLVFLQEFLQGFFELFVKAHQGIFLRVFFFWNSSSVTPRTSLVVQPPKVMTGDSVDLFLQGFPVIPSGVQIETTAVGCPWVSSGVTFEISPEDSYGISTVLLERLLQVFSDFIQCSFQYFSIRCSRYSSNNSIWNFSYAFNMFFFHRINTKRFFRGFSGSCSLDYFQRF